MSAEPRGAALLFNYVTTMKALIMDDDMVHQYIIERCFKEYGINTIPATTAHEGIEHAILERPEIVLINSVLPDMEGLEVLSLMQDDERLRSIPVVIISTSADPGVIQAARDKGAFSFIGKPVTKDKIQELYRAVWGMRT